MPDKTTHENKKSKAQRIKPTNTLSIKVGKGGLPPDVLNRAEQITSTFTHDYIPQAEQDLKQLIFKINALKVSEALLKQDEKNDLMLPVVAIKANAGLFHYHLLSQVAESMLFFIDYIERLDEDSLEILRFQMHIISRILTNAKPEKINAMGYQLLKEIDSAVERYCRKYPKAKQKRP